MADAEASERDVALVARRFPARAARVVLLAATDERFRGICEEYRLAIDSLARFEAMPPAPVRPEVCDYRSVIAELEGEIAALLEGT